MTTTTPLTVVSQDTKTARGLLDNLRQELSKVFLERERVVDGLLSAMLAGQHVLLLGPPGTAKSLLAQTLCSAIDGAEYFSWLLTRFSTPEELFGPISLAGLQQDRFYRKVDGKLPEAHIAFLDEIFKSNSSVLNALLTLINERVFHNDGQVVDCPLVTMVGASNELPEGRDLEALFDRFILRYWIDYLGDASNVRTLLTCREPAVATTIALDDLQQLQVAATGVRIPDTTVEGIIAVKTRLEEQGFRSSDRRWRQVLSLLKAYAFLEGDTEVNEEHFDLLPDMLWREPKDRAALSSIIAAVSNPVSVRALEILDAGREAVRELGQFSGSDAGDKAEWLKAASLVDTRLGEMERELEDLVSKHPAGRSRKAKSALADLQRHRKQVMERIARLYSL